MVDTDPLLAGEDGSPDPEDFLPDVIFFHGKELQSRIGTRQSFIRKPGTEQILVRIGIGRDGVYKVDGIENKIVEHWKFRDLKDWSFSGYSFTLQFNSSNHNYSVRTDDGEAICSYIDDFQKHPELALKRARENPPNSKIPESGVRTLRRKFSGTDPRQAPTASDQVKFYTMNRRTSKRNADPTSTMTHNIDVDSRLRDSYTRKVSSEKRPDLLAPLVTDSNGKVNGIPANGNSPVLDLPSGPTTTKGESTENMTTLPVKTSESPSTPHTSTTHTSTSSQPSSPQARHRTTLQHKNSEPILQTGRMSEHSSTAQSSLLGVKRGSLETEDPNDYFLLRQRSVSETTVQRGNQRPINLLKTVTMPWGDGKVQSGKSLTLGATTRRVSLPVVTEKSNTVPANMATRSVSPANGSKGVSPDPESQSVPTKQHYERRSSREGKAWYQSPSTPEDDKGRPPSPPYDTLSRSDSGMSSERMEFIAGIRSLKREDTSSMDDFRFNITSPPSSPLYDHLPPQEDEEEEVPLVPTPQGTATTKSTLPVDVPMRRNVSQPVMSGKDEGWRGGEGSRTSVSPGPDSIAEEDEEDSENEPTSTTNLDPSGVIRRQKKNASQRKESDPFEDILGTPQAVARLRWSQELNPLYDLIKGMKISESMSSTDKGIRLYSTSAPEGGSVKKLKKLPSVILEEAEMSPQHSGTGETVPNITHTIHETTECEEEGEGEDEGERIPMIIPDKSSDFSCVPRRQHNYEEVAFSYQTDTKTTSTAGLFQPPPSSAKKTHKSATIHGGKVAGGEGEGEGGGGGKSSLAALSNPAVWRLQTLEAPQERSASVSPRLGKRMLQRRSQTVSCVDDTEVITRKQKPLRAADIMKDFSVVMREFRLFYIKMPNGCIHSTLFSINRLVAELRDSLCDLLGVDNVEHYILYVEGACLTSLKEAEVGEGITQPGVMRSNSLTHIMDHQWLPDQGTEPVLLKPSLSLHMQGITTSRVLALICDDVVAEANYTYPSSIPPADEGDEFHKNWVSIVQGNTPCTPEHAVKLASIQYQAYFIDRTAVHSVVGFCRPNEFLPTEFSGIRGMEQKMYKEQEKLKALKTHREVHDAYSRYISMLPTYGTVFFPVREPRKKVLQSTKLKSIILGVGPNGIMRVDPKTKEVLDLWQYQVLRNWAYSRKTFVLAFTDKNYPVESSQAKWISMVVDFFVDSILAGPSSSKS